VLETTCRGPEVPNKPNWKKERPTQSREVRGRNHYYGCHLPLKRFSYLDEEFGM
jgi:hypothetical protein